MVQQCTSHPCATLPQHVALPYNKNLPDIHFPAKDGSKTISQLKTGIWDLSLQDSKIVVVTAIVTDVLIHRGWHYLSCPWCSKQASVKGLKLCCSQCDIDVDSPIPQFIVRFQVEDPTGSTVFIGLDSEVRRLVFQTATELLQTPEPCFLAFRKFSTDHSILKLPCAHSI